MEKSQIDRHGIWQVFDQADLHLERMGEQGADEPNLSEAKQKVSYVKWVLEKSDPSLIVPADLDNAQRHMQNVVNVFARENVAALTQADTHFYSLMQGLSYPRVKKFYRADSRILLQDFKTQIDSIRNRFVEEMDSAKETMNELSSQLATRQNEIEALKVDLENSDKQVAMHFDQWQAESKTNISERLAELNSEFSSAETNRRKETERQLERVSKTNSIAEGLLSETRATLASETIELRQNNQKELDEIKEKAVSIVDQIKNIYEVAGQTALAGDFERAAKSEDDIARNYSIGAAVFYILAPAILALVWFRLGLSTANIFEILARVPIGASFLVPAVYFGSVSQRHKRVSTALRSLGIRVATFDAYIANFENEEKTALKTQMADMFFSNSITPDRLRRQSPKELENIVTTLGKTMEKTFETIRPSGG